MFHNLGVSKSKLGGKDQNRSKLTTEEELALKKVRRCVELKSKAPALAKTGVRELAPAGLSLPNVDEALLRAFRILRKAAPIAAYPRGTIEMMVRIVR